MAESFEDDLATYEGWLKSQAMDPSPEAARCWALVEAAHRALPENPRPPRPGGPGEFRYAVAVRDSGLWLALCARRLASGDVFVLYPRRDCKLDAHTSYHVSGAFHSKARGRKLGSRKRQPLTSCFQGVENLGVFLGHGPKAVGVACVPADFSGIVEVQPGVLGSQHGAVFVDLVEPGQQPPDEPGDVARVVFTDATPWLMIRVSAR